jgi:hypothetical protein
MDAQDFFFIQAPPHRSVRDKNLRLSEVRAHSARISHVRNRQTQLARLSGRRSVRHINITPSQSLCENRGTKTNQTGILDILEVSPQGVESRVDDQSLADRSRRHGCTFAARHQQSVQFTMKASVVSRNGQAPSRSRKILPASKNKHQSSNEKEAQSRYTPHPVKHYSFPNPLTLMQHGNSDPFSASPIQVTPWTHSLIEIWRTTFLQTVVPIAAQDTSHSKDCWRYEGRYVMECPARLSFILTWTSLLKSFHLADSRIKTQLRVEALAHKAVGIAVLRAKLSTMESISAIRTMLHAHGAECLGGDQAAAVIHFQAIEERVRSLGGLQNLPWNLRILVVSSDINLTAFGKQEIKFNVVGRLFAFVKCAVADSHCLG